MRDDGKGILGDWDATGAEIRDALDVAIQEALREHKRACQSVVVWDREKDEIVVIQPAQIEVPNDSTEEARSNGVGPYQTTAPSHRE